MPSITVKYTLSDRRQINEVESAIVTALSKLDSESDDVTFGAPGSVVYFPTFCIDRQRFKSSDLSEKYFLALNSYGDRDDVDPPPLFIRDIDQPLPWNEAERNVPYLIRVLDEINSCFNCGEDHVITECPEPVDMKRVRTAREKRDHVLQLLGRADSHGAQFPDIGPGEGKITSEERLRKAYPHVKPGILSKGLQYALGMIPDPAETKNEQDLSEPCSTSPPYLEAMRQWGYPPAYTASIPCRYGSNHWGYSQNGPVSFLVASYDEHYESTCAAVDQGDGLFVQQKLETMDREQILSESQGKLLNFVGLTGDDENKLDKNSTEKGFQAGTELMDASCLVVGSKRDREASNSGSHEGYPETSRVNVNRVEVSRIPPIRLTPMFPICTCNNRPLVPFEGLNTFLPVFNTSRDCNKESTAGLQIEKRVCAVHND